VTQLDFAVRVRRSLETAHADQRSSGLRCPFSTADQVVKTERSSIRQSPSCSSAHRTASASYNSGAMTPERQRRVRRPVQRCSSAARRADAGPGRSSSRSVYRDAVLFRELSCALRSCALRSCALRSCALRSCALRCCAFQESAQKRSARGLCPTSPIQPADHFRYATGLVPSYHTPAPPAWTSKW
jgi:hypothetical protein